MHHVYAWWPQKSKEGLASLATGIEDNCEQ